MTIDSVPSVLMAEPSSTALVLRRLLMILLATALTTAIASVLVFTEAHDTVHAAGNSAGPAVMQVDAAYQALADADREIVRGALAGTIALTGPGEPYEADITAASQSLAQVGEDNVAGPAGSQQLKLVEGLMVSYTALVDQSDAAYQASAAAGSSDSFGLSSLLNASQLMHDDGILDDLGKLRSQETAELNTQRSAAWVNPAMSLLWMLPAVALLAMMAWTSVFCHHRFRRIVNVRLALAALALIVLSAVSSLGLVSNGQFASAQDATFDPMATLSLSQADATDADGQASLATLIAKSCPIVAGACAQTVEPLVGQSAATVRQDALTMPRPAGASSAERQAEALTVQDSRAAMMAGASGPKADAALPDAGTGTALFAAMSSTWAAGQTNYQREVSSADAAFGIRLVIIALMGALIVALIPFAIQPRINEYRYRSR
jgi:hypothetical protein